MERYLVRMNYQNAQPGPAGRRERGEGRLKAIVYTAVFALAIYVGVKIVPPYMANYQLSDKLEETARFALVNRYDDEKIRDVIFKEIQNLEIPVTRDQIKVTADLSAVQISLDYTVPVDLIVYNLNLHFTPSSKNKSLVN